MVSRKNDRYYGQWLVLHVPFRSMSEFHVSEINAKVPDRYYYLACARHWREQYWNDKARIRADMEVEAEGNDNIETVLAHIQASSLHVDNYMDGIWDKRDEGEENGPDAAPSTGRAPPEFHQFQLKLQSLIDKAVDVALRARTAKNPDELERLHEIAMDNGRVIVGLGGPGTGKTTVAGECIHRAKARDARILIALPTGQMSSRTRQQFRDVRVDTCHGAFLLHKAELEALPVLSEYDLVVVDEISQLSAAQFDRIVRMWHAADRLPALVFLGDFWQLPSYEKTRAVDSEYWKGVKRVTLTKIYRCKDEVLMDKIQGTRTQVPGAALFKKIVDHKHKAWTGTTGPSHHDLSMLYRRVKEQSDDWVAQNVDNEPFETTIVTCSRRGAAQVRMVFFYATY